MFKTKLFILLQIKYFIFSEEVRYNRAMLLEIREFVRNSRTKAIAEDLMKLPYFEDVEAVKEFAPSGDEYPKLVGFPVPLLC